MPKDIFERRDCSLCFRVSESEFRKLKQLAKASRMNVSEYVRTRLLEESFEEPAQEKPNDKSRFACDHDRQMMRLVMRTYLYSKYLAQKSLDKSVFDCCDERATLRLKEWGYE